MLAKELLPGQFFIYDMGSEQYQRCFRILHNGSNVVETEIPCVNLDHPHAMWVILAAQEVFI